MRTRLVKSEHWKDVKLGTVTRDARMLYLGLRALADCAGNLECSVLRIKGEVFPYDEDITFKVVENLIEELTSIQYVQIYSVDGAQYYHLPFFSRDDNPSTHEKKDGPKHPCFQHSSDRVVLGTCLGTSLDGPGNVAPTCPVLPLQTLTNLETLTNSETANTSPPRPQEPLPDNEPNANEVRKVPTIIPAKHRRWVFDEHFTLLREAYERAGVSDLIPDDWGEAYSVWALLDSEQRQAAIDGLNERVRAGTSAAYIPRPKRWLRGEYKRPIREPTEPARRGRSSPMDAILREM